MKSEMCDLTHSAADSQLQCRDRSQNAAVRAEHPAQRVPRYFLQEYKRKKKSVDTNLSLCEFSRHALSPFLLTRSLIAQERTRSLSAQSQPCFMVGLIIPKRKHCK